MRLASKDSKETAKFYRDNPFMMLCQNFGVWQQAAVDFKLIDRSGGMCGTDR